MGLSHRNPGLSAVYLANFYELQLVRTAELQVDNREIIATWFVSPGEIDDCALTGPVIAVLRSGPIRDCTTAAIDAAGGREVEAMLESRSDGLGSAWLLDSFPVEWEAPRAVLSA
jgi:hypothetical protein